MIPSWIIWLIIYVVIVEIIYFIFLSDYKTKKQREQNWSGCKVLACMLGLFSTLVLGVVYIVLTGIAKSLNIIILDILGYGAIAVIVIAAFFWINKKIGIALGK